VKGAFGSIQLVNSLNPLDERREILVPRVNFFKEPLKLPVGLLVGKFNFVEEDDSCRILTNDLKSVLSNC